MLRVKIQYTVDSHSLDTIKKGASKHLSDIQPALRMEICARALGFNTWAAMKASDISRRSLDMGAARTFAASRNVDVDPLSLHLTMADATLLRIAMMYPELHLHGVHDGYFAPSREERIKLVANTDRGAMFKAVMAARKSGFDEARAALLNSNQAGQVLRAMALFSSLRPTKTVGQKSRSSYGMKHVAEGMFFDLCDDVTLSPGYVSNVDAIIAALDGNFPIRHEGGTSPNVSIGITVASQRAAERERNVQKRYG